MALRSDLRFRYVIKVYDRKGKLVEEEFSVNYPKRRFLKQVIQNLPKPVIGWSRTSQKFRLTISSRNKEKPLYEMKVRKYPPVVKLSHLSDSESENAIDDDGDSSDLDDDDSDIDSAQ